MIVVITSECSGKARLRSQRILDDFLPRIGRRTWSGRITQQGLLRLKDSLAKVASTNSSICCQRVVGTRTLQVLWFVGSRKKFSKEGHCAVSETTKTSPTERNVSSFEIFCRVCTELAALFHDLGKNTKFFQTKLKNSTRIGDPVRHEVVSYSVMKAMLKLADNDERRWLEHLSDRRHVAAFIKDSFHLAFREFRALVVFSQGADRFIQFIAHDSRPKFSCVAALVLTHHRLPDARPFANAGFLMELNDVLTHPQEGRSFDDGLAALLQLPEGLPLWDDEVWLDEISQVAQRLLDCRPPMNFAQDLKASSLYGRTALILGDHKASEIGNTKFPKEGRDPDPATVYANTNKINGKLAEPLGSHLRRVRKETIVALDAIFLLRNEIEGVDPDSIPEDILYPRVRDSRFEWQAKSSRVTRKAFRKVPEGSGFFGVLMAGTGSGKTRAAPIIATAANSGKILRLNVSTGMRSLTLQGGREYLDDMHFAAEDVSVVIGDALTRELFELESAERANGTDADFPDAENTVQSDLGTPARTLPKGMMRFAGDSASVDKVLFLASPILVSTVDILMPAASAMRGNHVLKTLRVASADLVLDEIDDYSNEDIAALARLVYLTAAFGRKVIISSATVTPEIARGLFHVYREGWKLHCHAQGEDLPILCGWYSEAAEPKCIELEEEVLFSDEHLGFVGELTKKLDDLPAKRKAAEMRLEEFPTVAEFFRRISEQIIDLHDVHHVCDPATGKNFSVGVVRWNNVDASMLHAKFLLENDLDPEHCALIVPYNGTLLPAIRHKVESIINPMLRRKGASDPILDNDIVRDALSNRCTKKNLVIVIITTSMEEVGRDHDFDWGISEPNSLRSVIQIGGRIRRHRHEPVQLPNLVLMPFSFKELLDNLKIHEVKNSRYFSFPGIETPIRHNGKELHVVSLESHKTKDIYDLEMLGCRVDARDAIGVAPSLKNVLGQKERELTKRFLIDGKAENSKLSLPDFTREPTSLLTRYHPKNLMFRRPDGYDVIYFLGTGHRSGYWFRISEDGPKRKWVKSSHLVTSIDVDTRRLLIQIEDEEALASNLATKLWGDDGVPEWKMISLLSISRPIHGDRKDAIEKSNYTQFYYHRALGFCEKKNWHSDFFLQMMK